MMRYRMNTPSIIAEVLDGESVILNLDEGIYYSLGGVGVSLWGMITSGLTITEICDYFTPQDNLADGVKRFIDELVDHKLIVAKQDQESPELYKGEKSQKFSQPVLHIYEDMKELLLLDPIHEVDQAGWPVAP